MKTSGSRQSDKGSGITKAADRLARHQPSRRFPGDPVGKHIARLMELHPDIAIRFRAVDLAQMNDQTKQQLLDDLNDLLQIEPLSFSAPR